VRGGGEGRRGGGRGGATTVAARLHIARDGTITVMTGKVEGGQGARTELTQAAAEELRVAAGGIVLVMADTALVPDDGITAGSRSTPSTVPAIRHGAAAARQLLVKSACAQWAVAESDVDVRDGAVIHAASGRRLSYGELASAPDAASRFEQAVPGDVTVTPVSQWRVMGQAIQRPNARQIVTGAHRYPSDIMLPGMLHGKVLRPPSYGATLQHIDLEPAKQMAGVVVVQDGTFIGVAAPTNFAAEQALDAIAGTATWQAVAQPSSTEIYDYLRQHARGGVPANPFAQQMAGAARGLRQTYHVAYVQHAPLEPRAAVAQWQDGQLTVWTGSQNPFGVRGELMRAFRLGEDRVRVIVPDFGAGFGGSIFAVVPAQSARSFLRDWRERYSKRYPRRAPGSDFFLTSPGSGLEVWGRDGPKRLVDDLFDGHPAGSVSR
jgi:isoquinoline 1-oxidoreductase